MNKLVITGERELENLRNFLAANQTDYNYTTPTAVDVNSEDNNIYFINP